MAESFEGKTTDPIPETGMSVIVEPVAATFDIVFIHGFTGHPEHTWAQKISPPISYPADHSSKIQRTRWKQIAANLFSRRQSVFWPRDVLKHSVPDARVLTYGYDSHIRHWLGASLNQTTVYDMAWDFLVSLEAYRRQDSSRPLVIVAHSLGGIIVKEALRRSSQTSHFHIQQVCNSTAGVIFFGTPHSGADPRNFLCIFAEKMLRAAGAQVNDQIIHSLVPSSERLRELRDEFIPMAQERGWLIHSFQEQYGVRLLGGKKVVEDTSSYLHAPNIEIAEHIGRDHMEMCRFSGREDIEYKKVESAFQTMNSKI
ncbi:hypothetical protein OIDMADRAFT_207547, partial [Oidiodendron maius Zn]